jgi:hypothetical protein
MKVNEAQALLSNLLNDAEKACEIARVAARHKKSLAGANPYGNRFHAMAVSVTTMEGKVRSLLNGLNLESADLDRFKRNLDVLKSTDPLTAKRRGDAVKELRLLCQSVILPRMESMTASPVPVTEQVLPLAVVRGTRGYLEKITIQANGCYEHQWYDACSVMVRKLVENLIILVYELKGEAEEIKKDGDFLLLKDLIGHILKKTSWNLNRNTKKYLPEVKEVGDLSAHSRHYLATKQDIDNIKGGLRVIVDDLLHVAGLK